MDTPETPVVKQSAQDILADIMLRREAKEEKEKLQAEAKYAEKDARRQKQDAQKLASDVRRYTNCDHLQGNHKLGEEPFKVVAHLSHHTYQSGIQRIRCNKCGFRWFPGDTQDHIKRSGKVSKNPTGMSYKDAVKMCMKSKNMGNKPSKGFVLVVAPTPELIEE
jgi:hypothetical protein